MAVRDGKFVWYELLTDDDAGAAAFYGAVLGWTSKDAGMSEPYTLLLADGSPVGGIMTMPAEMRVGAIPPHWNVYVAVSDIAKTVAQIKEQGGKVRWGPQAVAGVGVLAAVTDPQGAAFSLLEPPPGGQAPPAVPPGTPGHAGWHELHAADGASAFDFYADLFGWTKAQATDMGAHGVYQTFNIGADWSGGVMTKMAHTKQPHWTIYFNVASASAALARITQAGGTVVFGPQEVPGGSVIVQGRDPQGAPFALVSRNA